MLKISKQLLLNIKRLYDEFRASKNKFYYLYHQKLYITASLALLTLVCAIGAFLIEGKTLSVSISNALKFFTFGFPDDYNANNILMLLATIFATATVFLAAIFTFFQDFINKKLLKECLIAHI